MVPRKTSSSKLQTMRTLSTSQNHQRRSEQKPHAHLLACHRAHYQRGGISDSMSRTGWVVCCYLIETERKTKLSKDPLHEMDRTHRKLQKSFGRRASRLSNESVPLHHLSFLPPSSHFPSGIACLGSSRHGFRLLEGFGTSKRLQNTSAYGQNCNLAG